MERRPRIPYGIKDFKRIRSEGYYYVDKTAFIRRMEERDSFVFFARPRRMGKSLFVETLRRYYDVNEKGNFRKLFGGLDIGEKPTENANRYQVLTLDFSVVGGIPGTTPEENFESYLDSRLSGFLFDYRDAYGEAFVNALASKPAAGKFGGIATRAARHCTRSSTSSAGRLCTRLSKSSARKCLK